MLFSIMNNICFSDEKCLFELIMLFLFFSFLLWETTKSYFFKLAENKSADLFPALERETGKQASRAGNKSADLFPTNFGK
jgi:hypothetical protein